MSDLLFSDLKGQKQHMVICKRLYKGDLASL